MLSKYLVLILSIAIACGEIKIKIRPTKKGDDTSVEFLGENLDEINDRDRELFKIDDETLKAASETFLGARCSSLYLKPPTPWGDVYKQYGWETVKRYIKPIRAKVIGVNSKPVSIGAAEYVNNHDGIDVTYSTSVTQQVEETVEHTWSQGGENAIGQTIAYEVNFGAGSVGGSTSLSYTSSWGEENKKARAVTLGTTSTVLVVVPPRNGVVATLIASQGTVDIEIRYSVHLRGTVFCNFEKPFKGHHFYALPLKQLQYAAHTSQVQYSTEKVSVGFYTNVRLEVSNNTSTQ